MRNIKYLVSTNFFKIINSSLSLVYLNIFLIILPFILNATYQLEINLPPDTDSYFNFYDSLTSVRTIGLPFLLSITIGESKVFRILQVNLFSIFLSIFIIRYFFKKYYPMSIYNPLKLITTSFSYAILMCPWAIFSIFQTLSDFSYSLISSSILISLALLINNFEKYKIKYIFLDIFALGVLFGLCTLIRPVGTFLPLFILLFYLLIIIKDFLLKNFIFHINKSIRYRKKTISLLLVFLISTSLVQGIYSINNLKKLGTYNYLSISSVNMKCWREIHSSSFEKSPKELASNREACILQEVNTLPNKSVLNTIKNYLSINTIVGSLRMTFDNDYISYLSLLGLYDQPDKGDASSIDYLYSYKLKELAVKSIFPRIKLFFPFSLLLILSFCSTIFFWFQIFKKYNNYNISKNISSRTITLFSAIFIYYLIIMSGSDTAGRYGLPITFLLTLQFILIRFKEKKVT